jgi:nicotinamidase-related amidase
MTSEPVRDPATDHLLTPENCLLALIDFQPVQVRSVTSMDHDLLVANVVRVARTARTFGLPIVLTTVNVATGVNQPTIGPLADVLAGIDPIDRTTMNSWKTSTSGVPSKRPDARSWSWQRCGRKCG